MHPRLIACRSGFLVSPFWVSLALLWLMACSLAPSPTPDPSPVVPAARPADTTGMILIPAGTFLAGSTGKQAEPNEGPLHEVSLSAFWIDRTEVTVEAYRRCVDAGRCAPLSPPSSKHCTFSQGNGTLPINCISYEEAAQYCLAHGKRLPTEAEWEYAARGSLPPKYPWGEAEPTCKHAISRKGNSAADGCGEGPAPVGERPEGKSPFGLLDMAGNVEEWVSDYYDDRYVPTILRDPLGAPPTAARVLRGGSWASPWRHLRVTHRSWGSSMERGPTVGFRCAVSP
ncbi:MAG: SUMF1/EgtB/PvdO family nonheme iron enzyme [Myxococcales bacterium]|nr:formylglycine-generating enzyme family protein [Polyangiaceae bacterium]MDW8251080.1 SUMF1/EgtB/PvdO family nonheme iron enzyme [Myxococcales bacterium]